MSLQETVANWAGTDDALLAFVNEPKHRTIVNPTVTLGIVGTRLGEQTAARLNLTLKKAADALLSAPDEVSQGAGQLIADFRERWAQSDQGIDFTNDLIRAHLTYILNQANWTPTDRDQVLNLGYVLESDAERELGRPATIDDVTTIRSQVARDNLESEYRHLMNRQVYLALESGNRQELVAALRAVATDLEIGQ